MNKYLESVSTTFPSLEITNLLLVAESRTLEIQEIDASLKDPDSPSEELFQLLFVSKYSLVHVLLFGGEGGRATEMAPREGDGDEVEQQRGSLKVDGKRRRGRASVNGGEGGEGENFFSDSRLF
ncbi:hypothetical protein ACOSQ3_013478 [Xanthoceras sorbifolium]